MNHDTWSKIPHTHTLCNRATLEVGFFSTSLRLKTRVYNMFEGNALASALVFAQALKTTVSQYWQALGLFECCLLHAVSVISCGNIIATCSDCFFWFLFSSGCLTPACMSQAVMRIGGLAPFNFTYVVGSDTIKHGNTSFFSSTFEGDVQVVAISLFPASVCVRAYGSPTAPC